MREESRWRQVCHRKLPQVTLSEILSSKTENRMWRGHVIDQEVMVRNQSFLGFVISSS